MNPRESRSALLSRRSFLKALGATATVLPFYQMLENNFVLAQTGALPLKFIGFGCFHGTAGQLYSRQAGDTDSAFSLTYPDSPFKPFDDAATYGRSFKSLLSIFEGFDFAVGEYDINGASMHVPMHGAMGLLMTGSCMTGSHLNNASIDQYLAAKYGAATRFRSLQIRGYDQWPFDLTSEFCMSFDASGTALAPLHDPVEIWNKFFAGTIVGSDAAAQAAAAKKRAVDASILDFVVKDIQRLNARLGPAEKQKLDQHLTVVRGLETRLNDVAPPSATCTPPPRRDPKTSGYELDKFANGNVRPICDFNIELLSEILVCDLTRFATFLFPGEFGPTAAPNPMTLIYDGSTVSAVDGTEKSDFPVYDNMHDNCAHRLIDGSNDQAVMSQRMVSGVNRMYTSRIAKVMQRLDQAGLLDSTVIMAGSDGGDASAHSTSSVPIMLAGGANGKAKFGKRIVAPGKKAQVRNWCSGSQLSAHNPILVAVANLFGENLTSYGTCGRTEYTQGISNLLG